MSGDSIDADDGQWKQLTLVHSGDRKHRIEIAPVSLNPLTLQISSDDKKKAHAVAFFLAMETQGRIPKK